MTKTISKEQDIKDVVLAVAKRCAETPGWAQESVVLREVRHQLGETDLKIERMILNAWHDLFAEKKLAWGYDLDNPNSPFFHVR